MKNLLGLFAIVCCLVACTTSKTTEQKYAQQRRQFIQLADSLNNRTFTLDFDYVMPRRGSARYITPGYSVRVDGDSINSYLPYFGVAYRADMSYDNRSPLDFETPLMGYVVEQTKKDCYRVTLRTQNRLDQMVYQIDIFANGKAMLDVFPSDREPISFSGEMRWEEER